MLIKRFQMFITIQELISIDDWEPLLRGHYFGDSMAVFYHKNYEKLTQFTK